jgi:hypothetical protein
MNKRIKSLTHIMNVRLDGTLYAMSKELAKREYLDHSTFVRRAIAKSVDELRAQKVGVL